RRRDRGAGVTGEVAGAAAGDRRDDAGDDLPDAAVPCVSDVEVVSLYPEAPGIHESRGRRWAVVSGICTATIAPHYRRDDSGAHLSDHAAELLADVNVASGIDCQPGRRVEGGVSSRAAVTEPFAGAVAGNRTDIPGEHFPHTAVE